MTGHSSYTADQRRKALDLYLEHGPAEAGRRTGIPSATIRSWARREDVTSERAEAAQAGAAAARLTWAQRRAEVCMRSGALAEELLDRAEASSKSREVRDYMASVTMAVNTAQLLDGAPTARVVSEVERRERVKALRDDLAERRAAKAS